MRLDSLFQYLNKSEIYPLKSYFSHFYARYIGNYELATRSLIAVELTEYCIHQVRSNSSSARVKICNSKVSFLYYTLQL